MNIIITMRQLFGAILYYYLGIETKLIKKALQQRAQKNQKELDALRHARELAERDGFGFWNEKYVRFLMR